MAIAEVVPVAIGLLLVNPLPVMAVALLLFSPRARSTALAFVAAWVLGMFVGFGIVLLGASRDNVIGDESDSSTRASVGRLVLGIVLLVLAYRQWQKRPAPDEEQTPPAWMLTLEKAPPTMALGIGALLSDLIPRRTSPSRLQLP